MERKRCLAFTCSIVKTFIASNTIFLCVNITPFDFPVVPDVYIIEAKSDSLTIDFVIISSDSEIEIPFRYLVAVHWKDFADVEHVSNLRLPDLDFEPGLGYYLQMSNDWSTWWDDPMRRLACTDRI